jgi:hypothetical protein
MAGTQANRLASRPFRLARGETLWLVFGLAAALVAVYAAWDLSILRTDAPEGLRVFGSYWASGFAAAHHLNPYAVYPLTWITSPQPHWGRVLDRNLNPPTWLPLFALIAHFDPNRAVRGWTLFSAALYIGSAALLVREYQSHLQHRQILWFLWAWPVFNSLFLGQNYAIITALGVGAWVLLERNRPVAAGICLGLLIAAKPNFGVWAIFLVLSGRRYAAVVAVVVAAACGVIPVVLYGPEVYSQWLQAVAMDPHWMFTFEVSLMGFATRLGHRIIGEGAALCVLVISSVFVFWKRPSLRNTSGIALSVAILASPLSWIHYLMIIAGPLLRHRWGWLMSLVLLSMLPPFSNLGLYVVPVWVVAGYFLREAAFAQSALGSGSGLREQEAKRGLQPQAGN